MIYRLITHLQIKKTSLLYTYKNVNFITCFSEKEGFVPAETVLAKEVGAHGTAEREAFDAKARAWYYGEVLKERRKELGLTQKELADNVGCKRTYINRIEHGETDMQLSSFIRIADALGLSLRLETSFV